MFTFLVGIVALWFVAMAIWLIRIEMAARYLHKVLDKVSAAVTLDIAQGRDWQWRFAAIDIRRDYDRIVCRFWEPPSRCYHDQSFMNPDTKR